MKLSGKLVRGTRIIKEAEITKFDESRAFHDLLEECFIELCRELDVQVPLWLEKNTKEFAHYRRTFFTREQFMDKVNFERLEIKLQ